MYPLKGIPCVKPEEGEDFCLPSLADSICELPTSGHPGGWPKSPVRDMKIAIVLHAPAVAKYFICPLSQVLESSLSNRETEA